MSFQLSAQLSSQLSLQLLFQQSFQSPYRLFQPSYQSSKSKNEQQHFSSNTFSSKSQKSEYDYKHKLSIIIKLYTNEKKYSEINDNFVFKINVFQNICNQTMLFVKTRLLTFSIMFKKMILNYYYNHIVNINHIFNYDQICNMIVIYFEKVEYKRIILNK